MNTPLDRKKDFRCLFNDRGKDYSTYEGSLILRHNTFRRKSDIKPDSSRKIN
jgi:hypothetical protein